MLLKFRFDEKREGMEMAHLRLSSRRGPGSVPSLDRVDNHKHEKSEDKNELTQKMKQMLFALNSDA